MICVSCNAESENVSRCLKCGASLANATSRINNNRAYRRDFLMPFKRLGLNKGLGVYLMIFGCPMLSYAALFEPKGTEITIGKIGLSILALILGVVIVWYLNSVTKVYSDQNNEKSA